MSALAERAAGHPIAAAIEEIRAVLDEVSEAETWSLCDGELTRAATEAARLVARAQALMIRLVGEVDARDIGSKAGASSTAGWVRHELGVGVRDARRIAAVAQALRSTMPATGRALAAGVIGLAHATVIVAAVRSLPADLEPGIVASAEADLIRRAAYFDPDQLARLGEHILTVVAPEVGEAREAERLADQENRSERRRVFTITPDRHGLEWLRGALDTESAAVLRAALAPLAVPRATAADGPDQRSPAHRNADALVEMCRRSLAAGDLPDIGGERPQLTVTVPLATLLDGVGAATVDDVRRLSPAALRRIACDSRVIPVVLGGPDEILDVGRSQRLFSGARRRALVLRDRGCAFPGCDRPPAWCDGHHIVAWADGGSTRPANGVLLCGHHHTVVHRDGWLIRMASDGVPEFTAPSHVDPAGTPQRNHQHQRPG